LAAKNDGANAMIETRLSDETRKKAKRKNRRRWAVEQTAACFIVRDSTGQALAYVYLKKSQTLPGNNAATSMPDLMVTAVSE
jgi:hypothetical protein